MRVGRDGRLRLALDRRAAGHSDRAIRARHQQPALHDAATVVVLRLGQEGIAVTLAGSTRPERADKTDESLVAVELPAIGCRIVACRFSGKGGRTGWLIDVRHLDERASVSAEESARLPPLPSD